MGILKDEIIGIIFGKGDNIISNKFEEILSEKKYISFCEEIPQIIEEKVLFPIESEKYFSDLQKFYVSRKVVARFVISLISTNSKSAIYLSNKFSEEFVTVYPQYKIFINRIQELLELSANIIELEVKNRKIAIDDQEIGLFIVQNGKEILEEQIIIEASMNRVEGKIDDALKKIEKLEHKVKDTQKNTDRNISSILSIGQLPDDIEYAKEVKDVEENVQQKLKFSQAIIKYNELITDIKETVNNPNELLTHIYLNLALCYANINDFTRADRSMGYAQKYCNWQKNEKYYYIKGYICWKKDKRNIYDAIELLDNAIYLDQKYYRARVLRCQFGAFVGEEKEKIISLLSEIEQDFQEDEKKSELYEVRGFIYKAYGDYDLAEKWLLKAEETKHSIEYLINLGILYYGRATINNEHGKRLLKVKIDYPEIFRAYEYFQKVMCEITPDELNLYKQDFIEIYISTCMLCEHPEQIENINITDVDREVFDYETQKNLIFYEAIKGKNVNVDLLTDEDRLFLSFVEKAECGEKEEAFHLVKASINEGVASDLERKYNMALQLAIALNRLDDFKQLRTNLLQDGIECPYLELYEAEYYDLIGDYEKSKEFYDSHIQESDELYILNAVLFYKKHSYETELKQAYRVILKKLSSRQIAMHNQERIIQDAIVYMAENDINLALEVLAYFDGDAVKSEAVHKLSEMIYLKVMDVPRLLNIYEANINHDMTFNQKINYIILLKISLKFEKAKEEAERLLNLYHTESRDVQIRYLELLSELCLFTDDMEKSVEYITLAKDLAQELVYDPVHQLYMSRLIRCGKKEGLSYGIQFKQTHPNVANWLQQFQVLEKNEAGETKIVDEFLEIIEKWKDSFEDALSYYRSETISFYQLQKLLGSELLTMLSIPDNNRVTLVIGIGNLNKIEEQEKRLESKIVVDAMTILFLKYYDIIEVLDGFSIIYVTYSSVEELEKIYIQRGVTLVEEVISWLKNDLRIELYPNYNNMSEEKTFYHPNYFMDSLETAKREKCQFLCIDAKSPLFFSNDTNYFVSIMSLIHREEGEKSSALVAKLLKHNVTFVNFRADDIIYSLVNRIDEPVVDNFFSIKYNCDSISFISVYRIAIEKLLSLSDSEEEMNVFLVQICKQIDITFSRARMYRWRVSEYHNIDSISRYEYYVKHNINLLFMLHEVTMEKSGLWDKIVKYPYKYFDVQILGKLSEDILEKKDKLEIIKDLLNAYSF